MPVVNTMPPPPPPATVITHSRSCGFCCMRARKIGRTYVGVCVRAMSGLVAANCPSSSWKNAREFKNAVGELFAEVKVF